MCFLIVLNIFSKYISYFYYIMFQVVKHEFINLSTKVVIDHLINLWVQIPIRSS